MAESLYGLQYGRNNMVQIKITYVACAIIKLDPKTTFYVRSRRKQPVIFRNIDRNIDRNINFSATASSLLVNMM